MISDIQDILAQAIKIQKPQHGHTEAVVRGAAFTKAVVIATSDRHAHELRDKYGVESISMTEMRTALLGRNDPIAFDNRTLKEIFTQAHAEIMGLRAMRDRVTAALREAGGNG
jgi:hypothetical protein